MSTLQIRNSTAEFLVFTSQAGEGSIEVRVDEGTVWLSQKLMAQLFDVNVRTVNEHLHNIFTSDELAEDSVIRNFRITAADGKGYVLDKARLENGSFLGEQYFDHLLEEIREIRLSERKFYQKITDIYATSLDYSKDVEATQLFFAKVQNKLHYAIHGATAAELLMQRANASSPQMGLTTWELDDFGKVSMEVAESFALSEFEQYRVVQDRLFQSDFDKQLLGLLDHLKHE